MTRRGWLLFISLCLMWGIPYLLIRVAVREISPATLVLARTTLGTAILLPLAARRGGLRQLWPYRVPVIAFAVVEIGFPWLLLGQAEKHLASSLTGLLIAAVPLIGATIASVSGDDDRLGGRRLGGLLLGLAGVVAIVGLDLGSTSTLALCELGLVAVGYAVGPIVLTRYLSELDPFAVIAASLAFCALAFLPIAAVQLPSSLPSGRVLGSVVTLAVVCTALSFVLFFALIAEIGPTRATVITYANSAVAAGLGVAVLGESFTLGMAVGFVLVLAGSFVATRPSGARQPVAVES